MPTTDIRPTTHTGVDANDAFTRKQRLAFWAGTLDYESASDLTPDEIEERDALLAVSTRPVPSRPITDLDAARAELLPGVDAAAAARIGKGPWFELSELEAATGLPVAALEDLLEPQRYEWPDGRGGTITLTPEPIAYVVSREIWMEREPVAEGFVMDAASVAGGEIVVLRESQLEGAVDTAALRDGLGNHLVPVVRDEEGAERHFVPGAVDVWFRTPVDPSQVEDTLLALGVERRATSGSADLLAVGLVQAQLPDDAEGDRLARSLEIVRDALKRPEIELAELAELPIRSDFEDVAGSFDALLAPADPELHWHAEATGLDAAHALTRGDPSVVIAVIDGGIEAKHLEIRHAVTASEEDFSGGGRPVRSHGTAVASLAVGSDRVRGTAPACTLRSFRISGAGGTGSYALRAAAIRTAVASSGNGERWVLNLSWRTSGMVPGIRAALEAASRAGVAVCMSAGNGGPDVNKDVRHWPSRHAEGPEAFDGMLAVAATGPNGSRAPYSFHGASSVSLGAPGGTAKTAGLGLWVATMPASDRIFETGTSFASPIAAGAVALVLSADPDLTAAAAVRIVRETCRSAEPTLNHGRLDIRAAVERASEERTSTTRPNCCRCDASDDRINSGGSTDADGPAGDPAVDNDPSSQGDSPVNVNEASEAAIGRLPGVGPKRAAAIVARRQELGSFTSLWQLAFPGGVGVQRLMQLGPRLML